MDEREERDYRSDREPRSIWVPVLIIAGLLLLGSILYSMIAANRNVNQTSPGVAPGIGGGPGETATSSPSPTPSPTPNTTPSDGILMPESPAETPTSTI
ncbi:hypothetical protein M1437_01880 [Patescibacteria group bacterium]|nr:hypothetical protein [Patescibacteria group bacterium]